MEGALPTYQWQFNGTNLDGKTNVTLSLTNVQPASEGQYSVAIVNPSGQTNSATATLTVIVPPTITQAAGQPDGAHPLLECDLENVTASGTDPLACQWYYNRTNVIDGTTNDTLILLDAQSSYVGTYSVRITNWRAALTSSNAALALDYAWPPAAEALFSLGQGTEQSPLELGAQFRPPSPPRVQPPQPHEALRLLRTKPGKHHRNS